MDLLNSLAIGFLIGPVPGPFLFEITRRSVSKIYGNFPFITGHILGKFILFSIVFLGVSTFLQSPSIKAVLFVICGLILLKLGISGITVKKEEFEKENKSNGKNGDAKKSFLFGFSLGVLNPILLALFISLSGSYLSGAEMTIGIANILSICIGAFLFYLLYSRVLSFAGEKIPSSFTTTLSRVFGAILVVYAITFFIKAKEVLV